MISVVVPVRDEERTVEPLYDELASALGGLDEPWEVVYVDDGSRDGTHAALARLHESTTNVRVVRMRRALVDLELLQLLAAHAGLPEHAPDGRLDQPFRMAGLHLPRAHLL